MPKKIMDFEHPTCKGKSIRCWIIYLKLLPLQGVTNERALTQGVASLALGYVLLGFQPTLTKSETTVFVRHQKFWRIKRMFLWE